MSKVQDILNLDPDTLSRLTRPELVDAIRTLKGSLRASIKRLENIPGGLGTKSPAYRAYKEYVESGVVDWTTRGKGTGKLQHILKEIKHFRGMSTITVSGFSNARKRIFEGDEGYEKKGYYGGSSSFESDFWDLYNEVKDEGEALGIPSRVVMAIVSAYAQQPMSYDDKLKAIRRSMRERYETYQDSRHKYDSRDWYNIGSDSEEEDF